MKIVDNLDAKIIDDIRVLWPDHHPEWIAEFLNTRLGRIGAERFSSQAIYNIAGMIRRLDSASPEG